MMRKDVGYDMFFHSNTHIHIYLQFPDRMCSGKEWEQINPNILVTCYHSAQYVNFGPVDVVRGRC